MTESNKFLNIFLKGLPGERKFFLYFLLILIIGFFYSLTLNDGRDFSGDTAKFQYAGKILGIVHPPGYPTYLLLNYIFVHIFPFGSLALKANLLSSIFSISASIFLFEILLLIGTGKLSAFLTTISFAFTFTLWSQSIYAEVYTLNILFVASTIYFLLKWHIKKEDKFLFLGCLLYSLSFGNHLSMITFLPSVFYLVLITDKKVFLDGKKIIIVFSFILAGAFQYFYLFFRNNTTIYSEMPFENFNSFLWFVTGGWFKSKFFRFSLEEILLYSFPRFIFYLLREFLFLLPVSFLGFFKLEKKTKIFFVLSILGNIILGLNYDIGDIYVYYLPTYFVLAIFLGKGIKWIEEKFFAERFSQKLVLGMLLPLLFFSFNYPHIKKSRNIEEDKKVKEILSYVDKDSIILTTDYRTYEFLLYFLIGEGKYRDKNIHVEFCNSLEEVRIYLCEKYPFYSPHFRKNIPLGRNVYFIKSKYISLLKKSGLRILPFKGDLYKLECRNRNILIRPFFLVEYPLNDSLSFALHVNKRIDYQMEIKEDSETVEIKGRGRIVGNNEKDCKIFVVFKADRRSYVFDNLLKNSEDYFYTKIQKSEIEKGFYRIGIFIKGRGTESLWFTESFYGAPVKNDLKKERIKSIKLKYKEKLEVFREIVKRRFL